MPNIQIFNNPEFGEIRTVEINGEVWFVGRDIAKALGYAKPEGAIFTHCRHPLKQRVPHPQSLDKTIEVTVIPEGDMYRLISKSKLKSAERFEEWVFDDVLPTIRKTGTYGQLKLPQNPMELLELHYEAIRHVDNKVDALASDLEQFKQELPLFGIDEDRIVTAVHKKGVECLGGKDSNAYNDKSIHNKVFRDIYRELKHQFGISGTYKQLKRSQCDTAVRIIEGYVLPIFLQEQVCDCNAQVNMGI